MRCYEVVERDAQPLRTGLAAEKLRAGHVVGTRRDGIFEAGPKGAIGVDEEVLEAREERSGVVEGGVGGGEEREEEDKG